MHRAGGPSEPEARTTRTGARLPRVRWLAAAVALAAVLLVPVGGATAAPTVITFDDVPAETILTNEYAGVSFIGSARVKQYASSFVPSGTQAARSCPHYESEDLACSEPIRMEFAETKYRIRLVVGLEFCPGDRTVELRAYSRGTVFRPPFVLRRIQHTFPANSCPARADVVMETALTYNGIAAAELDIPNNANYSIVMDNLEFERGQARFSFNPDPVDFGEAGVAAGSVAKTVTVTNTGQVGASASDVFTDGADSGDFVVVDQACKGRILAPGDQCLVDLRFDPSASGVRTARLVVPRPGADPPESVRLFGSGTVATTTTEGFGATTTSGPGGEDTRTTGGTGTTLPPVPTPTTIVIPSTTPGATLSVSPAIGVPGFVAVARGSGFSPGPAELSWLPGQGLTQVEVGPDGSFVVQVLIMPNDRLGRRTLVATGQATTATTDFLVVARSVKPSGTDVTQTNRSRRYNNR